MILLHIIAIAVVAAFSGYLGFAYGIDLGHKSGVSEGKVWGAIEAMKAFQARGSIERKDDDTTLDPKSTDTSTRDY